MTITTAGGIGVSPGTADFIGYRPSTDPDFPYRIFDFFILPWRVNDAAGGDPLREYLIRMQETFQALYQLGYDLRNVTSYRKCPDALLKYLDDQVGFLDGDFKDIHGLSPYDHRTAIKLATTLWRFRGTARGYEEICKAFRARGYVIYQWPYFQTITEYSFLQVNEDGTDAWLMDVEGAVPGNFLTAIHIVDVDFSTLNRDLVEQLFKLNMTATEWVYVRYALMIAYHENLEQYRIVSGTPTSPAGEGALNLAPGDMLVSDIGDDSEWTNYEFKARFYVTRSAGSATALSKLRFYFYYVDDYHYLYGELDPATLVITFNYYDAGVTTPAGTVTLPELWEDTPYNLQFMIENIDESANMYIQVYLDGVVVDTLTMTKYEETGGIGFSVDSSGAADTLFVVDDVEVIPLRAFNDRPVAAYIGPDVLAYPSAFTGNDVDPITKAITVVGGFGNFTAEVTQGSVVLTSTTAGLTVFTYTFPVSPTPGDYDTITFTDELGNSASVTVTFV